ncbi:hypothetical protein JYU34_004617 [Plutella xylostella]|uniref:Uncharacterized protein n=1 Tax=Plutella xylostella TaxID=51655 RepID=A0ABQ7QYH3_PLUXY|nr:hypothetical protein JYU34_004617 [Plutella xylostella]
MSCSRGPREDHGCDKHRKKRNFDHKRLRLSIPLQLLLSKIRRNEAKKLSAVACGPPVLRVCLTPHVHSAHSARWLGRACVIDQIISAHHVINGVTIIPAEADAEGEPAEVFDFLRGITTDLLHRFV